MLPWVSLNMFVGVAADEKVDEMEAETPEHLSELEHSDGQQHAPDKPDDNTGKPFSPQLVSPERPSSSDARDRHRRERRSSSRHSDKKQVEGEAASGKVLQWATGLVLWYMSTTAMWQQSHTPWCTLLCNKFI